MHLKDWQKKFTPLTIEKAVKYSQLVNEYKVEGNLVSATVGDSIKFNTSFKINANREVVDLKCNCQFANDGNPCKHMAGLIMYYEAIDKENDIHTPTNIYPLDLVWLEQNGYISVATKKLFIERKNAVIPSYRFFEVKVDDTLFYEVICDKYEQGKGRLFINDKFQFFVLDVNLSDSIYAIFDVFMAALQMYPAYTRVNLRKFDEYLAYEAEIDAINSLALSLNEETFDGILELQPTLDLITKSVSYKIIASKAYPIKDLRQFSEAITNHLVLTYGKQKFIHGYEYFSKKSQKHLDFILYQVNSNQNIIKDIPLNNPYAIDFFFSTCKNQTLKVEKYGDMLLSVSNQPATIFLKGNTMELFDRENILFVGALGAYYDNDTIIEYRKFPNPEVRKVFSFLAEKKGILELKTVFNEFLIGIFPKIKHNITITDEFYEQNDVPDLVINAYVTNKGNYDLHLETKLFSNNDEIKEKTPFAIALLENYEKLLENHYKFVREENGFTLHDIKNQYQFLTSSLNDLKDYGNIYLAEDVIKTKPRQPKKITINAKYDVNLISFSLTGVDYSKDDIKNILGAYKQKQKFVRLKDGSIIELNEKVDYLREIISDFELNLDEDFTNFKRPLSYAFKLLNHEGYDVSLDDSMQRFFSKLENYKNTRYDIPEHLLNLLKPYQIEANSWLNTLSESGFGGILADDMGLGKTIEMISLLLGDKKKMPSLVVCPMSLVYNWQEEIVKWNVDIKCIPIIGSAKERQDIIKNINPDEKKIYISSYDSLRRDLEYYNSKFRFIIADEAQYIKNQAALKSEAIKTIDSEVRFALTGTPIENGLQDMWNIFDFVAPGYLSNYHSFKSRYEDLILNKDVKALKRLQNKLKPFILRRTKKDVLKDLPDKTETIYYTKLNDSEQKLYDANVLKLKEEIGNNEGAVILSMLTRLRQICVDPSMYLDNYKETSSKLLLCVDIVKKAISGQHKTLIFSQFTSVFPNLEKLLNDEQIEFLKITGQTKAEERIHLVNKFNETNIPVMLISLKAGGTGLNLQSADTVIHLDPWWNVSVENQATDRAHRIGQQNQVNVIKLVAKNTIEDKVLELQNMKKELAESIMNNANANNITLSDIKELLAN